MTEEKTIFQGSPSQILNWDVFVGCLLGAAILVGLSLLLFWPCLFLLPIPLFIAVWKWLEVKCRVFELTTERIKMSKGVLTRRTDELELYRVNDITVVEPFFLRLFSLGNIVITTNDVSSPTLTIPAVKGVRALREDLRRHVEACRERKRVRVTEME